MVPLVLVLGAAEGSAVADAGSLLQQAKRHYEEGDFARSLRTLRRASRRGSQSGVVAQIKLYTGLNRYVLGGRRAAIRHFTEALRIEPTLSLDPHRFKPPIVELFGKVRQEVVGKLLVLSEPPGARIVLDGRALAGKAPQAVEVPVGRHRVVLRWSTGERVAREVVVRWSQATRVEIAFSQPRPPATPVVREAPPRPRRDARPRRRVWTWVAGGAALAAAGVGIGFSVSAASDFSEYETTEDTARFAELEDRIPRKRTIAGVMYGVGGALAVTAAVLWWLEGRSSSSSSRSARRVWPMLGPDVAGLGFGATY